MQDQTPQTLGDRVKAVRLEHAWPQAYLAEIVGVDASTISRIETGETRVAVDDASRLAKALGVSFVWLVDGVGPRARKVSA